MHELLLLLSESFMV